MVIEDMRARDALGRERYGTPLQARNGRNPALDRYEEALDEIVYSKQLVIEREEMVALIASLRARIDDLESAIGVCVPSIIRCYLLQDLGEVDRDVAEKTLARVNAVMGAAKPVS